MYYVASAAPAIMFYLIEGSFGTGKEPLKLKITALDSEREADRSHPPSPLFVEGEPKPIQRLRRHNLDS